MQDTLMGLWGLFASVIILLGKFARYAMIVWLFI
jgi:membrane protein YqaA with SNARE-associated domain